MRARGFFAGAEVGWRIPLVGIIIKWKVAALRFFGQFFPFFLNPESITAFLYLYTIHKSILYKQCCIL